MPQQQLLRLPAPTTEALPAPSPNHSDLAHQNVATVEASTLTDSILTIEASTLTDSIQMIDAFTTTESDKPMEIASSHPQPIHAPSTLLPPPVVVEKVTQTEASSPLRPGRWRHRQGPDRLEQWHKESMARLKEEASSWVAELNTHAEHML